MSPFASLRSLIIFRLQTEIGAVLLSFILSTLALVHGKVEV
jgi:hypothetical protein